jgi:DNA repair protein RadC
MTAAQKAAKEKFTKAIAYRSKTGVSLKEAFAHVYGKKVGAVKKKAAPKKKATVKKAAPKKKAAKKKKLGDYKNRDVIYKDPRGINTNAKGNYKVARNDAGKFQYFSKIGNENPSKFVSLSGYQFGKEIIVAGIGKLSTLKNLVPEIKLRVTRGKKSINNIVTDASTSAEIFKRFIGKNKIETQELVAVAYLDVSNKVLGVYVHSVGSISSATVDVRLILAGALQMGAVGLIICHNHPSGNLKPSDADKQVTKQLIKACDYHNIRVLDHVIISKDSFYSFAQNGLL